MRYIEINPISVFGLFNISPFGILVVLGVLIGSYMTNKRGKQLGLSADHVYDMIFWTLLPGFISAHVLDVVFYSDSPLWPQRFYELIDIRGRLSSMGGFLGAVLGLFFWCKRHKQPILPYADSLAYGLAFGWIFGRLGCFVVHDHPGIPTSFFLGVDYPDTRRHDLGFYEVLFALTMSTFFYISFSRRIRVGFYVAALASTYGVVRFFLDYLRIDTKDAMATVHNVDPRYFLGLTPAQYAAILVAASGFILGGLFVRNKNKNAPEPKKQARSKQ